MSRTIKGRIKHKIIELLDLKGIELGVSVGSKEEAINKLVD